MPLTHHSRTAACNHDPQYTEYGWATLSCGEFGNLPCRSSTRVQRQTSARTNEAPGLRLNTAHCTSASPVRAKRRERKPEEDKHSVKLNAATGSLKKVCAPACRRTARSRIELSQACV